MMRNRAVVPLLAVGVAVLAAACTDAPEPMAPADDAQVALTQGPQDLRAWFARSSPEVLALPQTVFASIDHDAGALVFGVEHPGVERGVRTVLTGLGIPTSAYRIEVTEPIHFMSTLRDRHRPTKGGIQIHFGIYVCTLGFNVDHGGGRSFITNSHCTDKQGENTGTLYYQPSSSVDSNPIAVEADDPEYFRGGVCPRGRRCRYSDAARALYNDGTGSDRGEIAKTTGVNNGDLTVDGEFTVASQNADTSFSGTFDKVGRTTGWTRGSVANSSHTCATVNVAGSNVTMLCQTLVSAAQQIVAGGDSGSPVFRAGNDDNVELVGILWGGSSGGDRFVFSPFKFVQDELGTMTATKTGDAPPPDENGNGNGNGNGDDNGGNCPPNSNAPHCRNS